MKKIEEIEFYIDFKNLPEGKYRLQYDRTPLFENPHDIPVDEKLPITNIDLDKFPYLRIVDEEGVIIAQNKKAYRESR